MVKTLERDAFGGDQDDGFTVVETVISLGLFVVLIAGLAGSVSIGLRLVGGSSARQSATQVASQEVERLRALGYSKLGHTAAPAPLASADTDNPDNDVQPCPAPSTQTCYRVPDVLVLEPFVVAALGETTHGPDTVVRDGKAFTVYRYVTVVDGAPSLKRLTVVAQASGPAPAGGPNRVVLSTIFSMGVISF